MLTWLTQSYWRDEAFSIMLARENVVEMLRLSAGDFSPPFYHILLKVWVMFWGETEVATRSLSVLCFIGTAFTLVLISRNILNLRKWYQTTTVIFLTLLSPILTYYAFETRMYSLTSFLASLSFYFFLKKKWTWYVVVSALGLYTHYFIFFIIAIQLLYCLFSLRTYNSQKPHHARDLPFPIRYSIFVFLSFLPWVILTFLMHQGGNTSGFWIPKPSLYELMTIPATLFTGYERGLRFKYTLWPLTLLLWATVIVPLLNGDKKLYARVALLSLWAFGPAMFVWVISQISTPLFLPRYLIVCAPAVILLVSYSVSQFKPIPQACLLVLFTVFLWAYQSKQLDLRTKSNLRATIRDVSREAAPTDYLFVESELDFHIAQVYWHDPKRVKIIGKTYDQIPQYVGKVLIPEQALVLSDELTVLSGYVLSAKEHIVTKF